jgi:hypothetical protein
MQSSSHTPSVLTLTLVIAPEGEQETDPTAIYELVHDTRTALRHQGLTIEPLYTGQRGGIEQIFQIVLTDLTTIGATIMAQKQAIELVASLCSIFQAISLLVTSLFQAHQKQADTSASHKLTVSVTIEGVTIELTAADVANDERILALAERILSLHPALKLSTQPTVQVTARVPKKQHRGRK